METEAQDISIPQGSPLNRVTPLSKYLAMTLFVAMPFIGGWVGYTFAPEKVIEIQKVMYIENDLEEKQESQQELHIYRNEEFGFEIQMTKKWAENMQVEVSEPHLYGRNIFFKLQSRATGQYKPVCYISASTHEEWDAWQKEEMGRSVYLASSTNLIFGYGCGHDDAGFVGFEEFDTTVDEERLGDISTDLVPGPFEEFRKSVKDFFRVIGS